MEANKPIERKEPSLENKKQLCLVLQTLFERCEARHYLGKKRAECCLDFLLGAARMGEALQGEASTVSYMCREIATATLSSKEFERGYRHLQSIYRNLMKQVLDNENLANKDNSNPS